MIDTKALRNKILDLAISGKLTEQLPEDGNAEDLYAQIQEEKAKLIADGKIKKEKSLPPITEEEIPFEIPDNWKWVRIGSIAVTSTGSTPSKTHPEYYGGNYPFFKPSDLDAGQHIRIASEYLSDEGKNASRQYKEGTILVCCIGSIGKAAIIDVDGTANQQINAVKPIMCNSDYLFYTICNDGFIAQLLRKSRATTIAIVNKSGFDNCCIPLPPLAEQKRIVSAVEDAFVVIDRIEKAQKSYYADQEVLKNKIIDAGIRGKLTEQLPEDGNAEDLYAQIQEEKAKLIAEGKIKKEKPLLPIYEEEIPFEIPQNWKWVRWGELSQEIQYGYNAPAQNAGTIKMVRISDIQDGKVMWDKVPYCVIQEEDIEKYLLQPNDILFARTGGTVGKSYLVKDVTETAVYAGYLIRTRYSSLLSPEYMKYFMESQLYWNQLQNGTIATAQPNCNGKTLAKMILPLPPIEEQKRISIIINELQTNMA